MFAALASIALTASCGGERGDQPAGRVRSGISTECGLAPQVPVCEVAVCVTDGTFSEWETEYMPDTAWCNGTGHCDGAGNCIMPPPPSCDNVPGPRIRPGQGGNYPNGADILTCTHPAAGVDAWHIAYPSVDQLWNYYPAIAYNAGDSVTITAASGCVQTQGIGNTWKRYVNPEDSDGHEMGTYYGTLSAPGVTGVELLDAFQPLHHWIGTPFVPTAAGALVLGYADDNLSDNGYYDHDDGDLGQCAGTSSASVDVVIDHRPRAALTCQQWNAFKNTSVRTGVPELAQIASLLSTQAEVPIGLPITPDATSPGITHFQVFQNGQPGDGTTHSNFPLNSAELHSDGCVYTAYTPITAPAWYPTDLAFDKDPNHGWLLRPWDPSPSNVSFLTLQGNNRLPPSYWPSTFVPGTCGGAGTSWRTSAPRWIKTCNPQNLPPSQWNASNLSGFPSADAWTNRITHSGAVCNWNIKASPLDFNPSCVDSGRAEWTPTLGGAQQYLTAEGIVTNSFLSGGDFTFDHSDMPDGHFVGVHTDPLTHTDVHQCDGPVTAEDGDYCADWEMNLLVDANYRHMLAADESLAGDAFGSACYQADPNKFRRGNQADDLKGALGIEGEQWYYPLGFRPDPGDRALVRGSYIVDCGHPDWHTELHPASVVQSSFLQMADYSPVSGATWNRPPRLTDNWRSITGGKPAVVTKLILSPAHAEPLVTVDIWPPARPCAGARLSIAKEYEIWNSAWSGIGIVSETLLPADNPNHLEVTFQRAPYTQQWGGDGDLQNPDPNLTFFQAYMAWWNTDGVACPSAGGPGSGACVSNQGSACGACSDGLVQCDGSCSVTSSHPCAPAGGGLEASFAGYGSTIASALNTDGRLAFFGVDSTQSIFQRAQTTAGGSMSSWSWIDGYLTTVASETNLDGRIELFAVQSNFAVWHRAQLSPGSSSWSPWVQYDGYLSTIAAARNADGRLELFGTNSSGNIWHRWQTSAGSSTWAPWVALDGYLTQVAAETNADGRIELFGLQPSGAIWHRAQLSPNVNSWSDWVQYDGYLSTIAAARNPDGRLELFGTNSAGYIWHRWQTTAGSSTWAPWTLMDGALNQVAAETNADGRIELFGVQSIGAVYHRAQSSPGSSSWSSWGLLQ